MIDFVADNWVYIAILFCFGSVIVAGLAGAMIAMGDDPQRFDHIKAEIERAELLDEAEQEVKQRRRVRALS